MKSDCQPFVFQKRDAFGFSLIEVLLVVGIVALVLIPAMGALAMAYRSSNEARKNMEVSIVLQSASAAIRSMASDQLRQALDEGGLDLYFAEGGRYLGTNAANASNLFYRVSATRTPGSLVTNSFRQEVALTASYPSPAFSDSNTMPVSVFGYGSRF